MKKKVCHKKIERFKLNDIYRILQWIFNSKKRPGFFIVKNVDKPIFVNFIFISNYNEQTHKLPTNNVLKFNENYKFCNLPFVLTRENNIRELKTNFEIITKENVQNIKTISIEQLYDNKIFINSDVNIRYTNKNIFFEKSTKYFLIAMDIEMVTTKIGKEVGRISLVDHVGNLVYDKFVKPTNNVCDYETEYSGLTEEKLEKGIDFDIMREDICNIIGKDTIILGHGLENDLTALKMDHDKLIDTSYLFLNTESRRISLQQLAKTYLQIKIQDGTHCSVVDATTCLQLLSLKLQEIKIACDRNSKPIKTPNKIIFHNEYKEFADKHDSGLNICMTSFEELDKYFVIFSKNKSLTFFWYTDSKNKIKLEF